MAAGTNGNCFICGAELGKTAMKNHIIKTHSEKGDGQSCCLLKIEGAYNKDYWLFVDIPFEKTLDSLDKFLRKIWLECCGHLSAFRGSGQREIGKARKLKDFSAGDYFMHEYDFGSTTEILITIVGEITRPAQKDAVRLLARNVPPQPICALCTKPAEYICIECMCDYDNPFYCKECGGKHEHDDMLMPLTNSPRMGTCGYSGEFDTYTFDSEKFAGKK